MMNKKFTIITALICGVLLLSSCSTAGDQSANPQEQQPEAAPISTVQEFFGTVLNSSALPNLVVNTLNGERTLDTTDAVVYGSLDTGDEVFLLTDGDDAILVADANENYTAVLTEGYIVASDNTNISVMIDGSVREVDIASADILGSVPPTVGDLVSLTTTDDGRVIKAEVRSLGKGEIFGTVMELTEQVLVIRTADEMIFPFSVEGLDLPDDIGDGDEVSVLYTGTLAGVNTLLSVQPAKELPDGNSLSGVVSDIVFNLIMVMDENGQFFPLTRTADNTFSGGRLSIGDSVTAQYSVIDGVLTASELIPTGYYSEDIFQLTGAVTRYEPGVINLRTENGNLYTLSHNEATANFLPASTSGDAQPTAGDEISVLIERSDNDFLRCVALYEADGVPSLETVSGRITDINDNIITLLSDGEEYNFTRDGAQLVTTLPLRRDDEVTVEFIDFPSGDPLAFTITYNSSPTPFEPTPQNFDTAGVSTGIVISVGELLCVKQEDGVVYAFTTQDTTLPEGDLLLGDEIVIQYLGDPIQGANAVLITHVN